MSVIHDQGRPGTPPKNVTHEPAPTVPASTHNTKHWKVHEREAAPRPPREGEAEKPAYRVPLMSEIEQIEPNGFLVASTFAGAGGSTTGYRLAGFTVGWANEFEPHAADTYAANHPSAIVDRRDIREIEAAEIIEALGGRTPDLFDGSPPCQDFSMAGKRSRGWGETRDHADGTRQRSDDLFGQYARLLEGLQPKLFVAENVKGLTAGVAKGYFKRTMAQLEACGYRVRAKILDAQWLGVPQRRQRVIIIGVREDLTGEARYPKPLPYRYSMLEACPWIAGHDGFRAGDAFSEKHHPITGPSPAITVGGGPVAGRWALHGEADVDEVPPGEGDEVAPVERKRRARLEHDRGSGMKLAEQSLDEPANTISVRSHERIVGEQPRARLEHNHTTGQKRTTQSLDEPAVTITTVAQERIVMEERVRWGRAFATSRATSLDDPSPVVLATGLGRVNHDDVWIGSGDEGRKLTIPELKRICSFPDDYLLDGSFAKQWSRLGNSVPPLMMFAIARELADLLREIG